MTEFAVAIPYADERAAVPASIANVTWLIQWIGLIDDGDDHGGIMIRSDVDDWPYRRGDFVSAHLRQCLGDGLRLEPLGGFEAILFGNAQHDGAAASIGESGNGLRQRNRQSAHSLLDLNILTVRLCGAQRVQQSIDFLFRPHDCLLASVP